MPSSRRAFLKTFLSGTGCFAAAAAFPFAPSEPARPNGDADVHFPQCVASGDPTPDSILLWTRVQRADAPTEHPVPLVVQVSRRHDFGTVLAERALTVTAASDHTARVFVHDLPSDSVLFYRFLAGDGAAARELSDEYNALKQELSDLYDEWEVLTEYVMALED